MLGKKQNCLYYYNYHLSILFLGFLMKLLLLFFCFLMSVAVCAQKVSVSVPGARRTQGIEIIKQATEAELAEISAIIKANEENFKKIYDDQFFYFDERNGYIVDINNDGVDEYVFLRFEGSGHYLDLQVWSKDGERVKLIQAPRELRVDHPYHNPLTRECELFVRAQGKVYICGSESLMELVRSIYLWEKATCTVACDTFWIQQQRNLFNELYKHRRYNDAFSLLYDFETRHRNRIAPQKDLWLRNDCALAVLRDGYPNKAREILMHIQNEPTYKHAASGLVKAVETNIKLAEAARAEERRGDKKYDCAWLLEYVGKSAADAMHDERFMGLMSATVPDIEGPKNYYGELWRDDVYRHFGVTSDDVTVVDGRYVSFSGWWPHSATNRGFLWCDVKNNVTVVAIGVRDKLCSHDKEGLHITSRSLLAHELPHAFAKALAAWKKYNEIHPAQILFYDRLGENTRMTFLSAY